MDKIRIQRNKDEIYEVNISDDGKTIKFDLLDINFPYKLNKAFNDIERNRNICLGNIRAIEKRQYPESKKGFMTQKELEITKEYSKMFKENRKIMDSIFGDGTMQALFGDTDYLTMYDDLFTTLEPVFNKLNFNVESVKNRIKAKYQNKDSNVLKVS